jgi:hypothetical protein
MNSKYERLLKRVEAIENRLAPTKVIFQTVCPGEQPEPIPDDPSRRLIIFRTRYLSRKETEAERERSYIRPDAGSRWRAFGETLLMTGARCIIPRCPLQRQFLLAP